MATPQRSDRTLALRRLAVDLRRGRIRSDAPIPVDDLPEREELTRPGLPESESPRSLPRQIGDSWLGLPLWVRIVVALVPTVPIIVGAIVQILSVLR
jgi:hypothetical protein